MTRYGAFGGINVNPSQTTTYIVTCFNSAGQASDTATVTVNQITPPPPPPAPSVDISADQTFVNFGGSTTIRWNSSNATSCNASGGTNDWAGLRPTSGFFFTGALNSTKTFSITCTNSVGNSAFDSVTVQVGNEPPPPPSAPSVDISADQTFVNFGISTTIRWFSSNATSCQASGGTSGWSGAKNLSGSFPTGSLASTKTYTITCFNSSGQSDSDQVLVNV